MSTNQTLLQYAPAPRALGKDETWNVFLSYRSVDRPWVINLYDVLRSAGHKVFLDQVVLKAGDELVQATGERARTQPGRCPDLVRQIGRVGLGAAGIQCDGGHGWQQAGVLLRAGPRG